MKYSKEEREQKRSERMALLDRAVEELTSSEAWASWLKVRRNFHAYSWRNQLMISIQRPDTIGVNGFTKWRSLNRSVKRGAKTIWILAPAPFKTGEKLEDGSDERKMWFKPVCVFAYEDTEQIEGSPEIPFGPPINDVEGDNMQTQLERLCEVAQDTWGIRYITFEPIEGRAHGWYRPATRDICVDHDLSINHQFKTLVHEVSHHLVATRLPEQFDRDTEEVVVESTAYAVCATFGLETAGYSAAYVASWQEGTPKPEQLVAIVDELATTIEEALRLDDPGDTTARAADPHPDSIEQAVDRTRQNT